MNKPSSINILLLLTTCFLITGMQTSGQQPHEGQTTETITARVVTELPAVLIESSGIAVRNPNRIWSHNDSGYTNQLFCFDTIGQHLRTLLIINAGNVDWEDLAVDDQNRIYISDAGNNRNDRTDLAIYRIPDPETSTSDVIEAEKISFTFEDQYQFPPPENNLNFDVEAIIWKNDSLYLFTKNRSTPQTGICKMYSLPAEPGIYTAKLVNSIFLGTQNDEARVTAADINPETGELLLLTRARIVSFTGYPAGNFFKGKMTEYFFDTPMGQIEAIAFVDNETIYLTEELAKNDAGNLYEVKWQGASTITGQKKNPVSIFPNPFTNTLAIESSEGKGGTVEIWDMHGKRHFRCDRIKRAIDLSHLPSGVYIIRLDTGDENHIQRIVKQ
jgi:hypothetical protein